MLGVEKKGDAEIQVQIRLESPPFHADGTRATNLPTLVDAKGEGYQLGTFINATILVDGVELLAALFHPHRFGHRLPDGARRIG